MTQFGDTAQQGDAAQVVRLELDQPREASGELKEINTKMTNPLISVCLITHNHAKYIRDAIQGILMQQTRFPWELIVADDCSTDGTKEILEEYKERHPNLITLILQKTNVGAGQNWLELITTPKSKYIAYCEGDDYWTDPLKLQKQVSLLESNDQCGMVYSRAMELNSSKPKYKGATVGAGFRDIRALLLSNPIPSLTIVVRTQLYHEYIKQIQPQHRNWKMGDYPGWLWLAFNSQIMFMSDITGMYRVSPDSGSHSSDPRKRYYFNLSSFEIAEYFAREYCNPSDYASFLENRYVFLYLSCVKKNLPEQVEHLARLRKLQPRSWRTTALIWLFGYLKLAYLAHLVFGVLLRDAYSRTGSLDFLRVRRR